MTRANTPVSLPARPRILVVSLRRIGDALLTTPLIRSLRERWPDARVDVLTYGAPAGIIESNPDVDRVIVAPARPTARETRALMTRLFKRYHLAISTQPGDRPTFFAMLAGRTHAGLVDPNGPWLGRTIKSLLLHRSTLAVSSIHRVEQMLHLADAIGVVRAPELVCPAPAPIELLSPGPYAVIHAAPTFRYKQWTRDGWRTLAAELKRRGLAIVATSGPDEAERRSLESLWQGIATVHSLTWEANVALLAGAEIYIGPDTSMTHLAAAAGCSTVALFGPSDPRVWGPWPVGGLQYPWEASGTIQNRGNVWVVQNPLPCVPCGFEGCERHIASGSICLDELRAGRVLAAVDQALAQRTAAARSGTGD